MITLKEAFRHQKFLADLQGMCWRYLADKGFYTPCRKSSTFAAA